MRGALRDKATPDYGDGFRMVRYTEMAKRSQVGGAEEDVINAANARSARLRSLWRG
jgi:hypothetical protein